MLTLACFSLTDLDQLATQMYASLNYIQTRHSYAQIEGQPDQNPHPSTATIQNGASQPTTNNTQSTSGGAGDDQPSDDSSGPIPDPPEVFQDALKELAHDLVLKQQQIEVLINHLPGIGTSERDQNQRIRALEKELREVEEERQRAVEEKARLLGVIGGLAANCRRVY